MSDKQTLFNNLSVFEMADLFLTDKTDQTAKEIYHNTLALTISSEVAKKISTEEVLASLAKIKTSVQNQLLNSPLSIDMNYHVWFNELEGQLIICLINANHDKLPLEGEMQFVETEQEVIYRFLTSPYLDGLLLGEESKQSVKDDLHDEESHIWIYKERIVKGRR
ncbi:MAG: hypothetical protein Q8909_04995 [Bacteroidota bacterium]|nr:hypothetical protein [Bacteroidota bacterium]